MIDVDRIIKLLNLNEEDESDHFAQKPKTGFYGKQGAGCIFFAKNTRRFLIGFRSNNPPPYDVEQPHTWGTFGGAVNDGENPKMGALREAKEETGFSGSIDQMIPIYVFTKGTFRYSNFIVVLEDEFEPRLNWENDDARWCEFGRWPRPLHFGLKAILSDSHSVDVMKKLSGLTESINESSMRKIINLVNFT